ncbi:MAG: NUDIX hydrolase [Syntrophomonadales bacterium]|jgi:coenzyme A diphosphatase NUDT7
MMENIKALRGRKAKVLGHEDCFQCAVIVPLIEQNGETCVILEERTSWLTKNPGEISFPGGRIEPGDGGELEAGIRETCEELGLHREDLKYVAPLDILLTPFNLLVYPFVCEVRKDAVIRPNLSEVNSVLYVPLTHLLENEPIASEVAVRLVPPPDYPYDLIPRGKDYPWREGSYAQFFYPWQDHVIWGLTARILYHFLSLLK